MRVPAVTSPEHDRIIREVVRFCDCQPCGTSLAAPSARSDAAFDEVAPQRYALDPNIPLVAGFDDWRGQDVLEIGGGPCTDGEQFASPGASHHAVDLSTETLLARSRFELRDLKEHFVQGDGARLPFDDDSFDLVYSHDVIHHIPNGEEVAAQVLRVRRLGGTGLEMVHTSAAGTDSLLSHNTDGPRNPTVVATLLVDA